MRPFAQLLTEATAADVTGWGFDWLDGRASEQRPPWGYATVLAEWLARVESALDAPLPFPDGSFQLVTSRHPVRPDWTEIHRVLEPGGHYVAQHVGPASAFELIEHFLGPLPEARSGRDPQRECAAAQDAGLVVTKLRTARCRMEFFDVGAVVWILRKCVWWVPDFTVEKYLDELAELDRRMRRGKPFVAHSTRHLIQAQRPMSQ